ncbi:MAG: radical SAM protein [Pirellulales bacterium]|nr:radical SAM protein [Pirellulales bacterium]
MTKPTDDRSLFESHSRQFEENRYVYPVLSRRASGISIGVNLNLNLLCNFNCIYCQVTRPVEAERSAHTKAVDVERLAVELDWMVDWVHSGRIWQGTRFAGTPENLRRLNDIAFCGDGEPTICPDFDNVVSVAAEIRARRGLDKLKLILITNSTLLDRPHVQRGLEIMDKNGGEIWAKLDAGSEKYYQQVARTNVPFGRILDNILQAAKARPIVIQSLFMQIDGRATPESEQEAYCRRLRDIIAGGGQIKLVQIHTVARPPAESWVSALSNEQVDALADRVHHETGLTVTKSYG